MLCTPKNWPGWRPPSPKLVSTCSVSRSTMWTRSLRPSATKRNVCCGSRENAMSQTAPSPRVRFAMNDLLHERAVALKHLDPVVGAIAHVHQPVVRDVRAVHRAAELPRRRRIRIVRPEIRVVRLVAVGAPVALELAGVRIDDHDAPVAVAVGDVRLVHLRIDDDLRGAPEVLACRGCRRSFPDGRPAAGTCPSRVNFRIVRVLRIVAADPDVAFVVHRDAVVGRAASRNPAPGPPHWPTRLPSRSNSSTGGAPLQHTAGGSFSVDAPVTLTVRCPVAGCLRRGAGDAERPARRCRCRRGSRPATCSHG